MATMTSAALNTGVQMCLGFDSDYMTMQLGKLTELCITKDRFH